MRVTISCQYALSHLGDALDLQFYSCIVIVIVHEITVLMIAQISHFGY